MKEEMLFEILSDVDEKYIAGAREARRRKRVPVWGSVAAAACVCLIAGGVICGVNMRGENRIQTWNPSFTAKEYFRHSGRSNGEASADSIADADVIFFGSRLFSDNRKMYEENNAIPTIETHPLFNAVAYYDNDGSFQSITMSWHRRDADGLKHYSDLSVTAGFDEVKFIEDCICIEVDEKGNIIEPAVTVTERDGVQIVAKGGENREKTITFKNEHGWYQISGSFLDSYEAVVELYEWFWEHPLDFSQFAMENGAEYTYTTLDEAPDAFSELLPDFGAHGFVRGETTVSLKNGTPVAFEGHYYSSVAEEQVQNGEYSVGENGCTEIHWCIDAEPDYYTLQDCTVSLEDITKEQVLNLALPDKITSQTRIRFMHNGYVVTIYATDVSEAWELIEALR